MKKGYEDFFRRIQNETSIKIYGAGKFAQTLGCFFLRLGVKVEAFIVSNTEENPTELLSRPVIALNSLSPSSLCDIAVGVIKKEDAQTVYETLQARQAKNIIIVPPDIVDDIYYNFTLDTSSLDAMVLNLKKEPPIFVYVSDSWGECAVAYMLDKNVQIKALCADRTDKFLSLNLDVPLLPYGKFLRQNKDAVVVLAIRGILWKKNFINRLRRDGFEKIVIFPDEYMEKMAEGIYQKLWEEPKKGFCVIQNGNVESYHYLTQIEQNGEIYRWRNRIGAGAFCGRKIQRKIQDGSLLEDYCQQYPNCSFLPYAECPLSEVIKPEITLEVYMAKFHKDKKVAAPPLPEWVIPIQVGKALTDLRIANCCDNTGDHISKKNVDYSEGTALYWMWKNTYGQDYIGLFHYRRQMAMGKTTLEQMLKYDAVLTVPTCLGVSVKDFFCNNFILDFDWELMMRYTREYDMAYYETAQKHEKSQIYFSCNIFIMKRRYFDEMCGFIFGVLEKVERFYQERELQRKDRYMGYLVENLLSIYFMHQAGRLKLAYTDMKFYDYIEDENQ